MEIRLKASLLSDISKNNKKTNNGMPSEEKIKRLIEHYRKGRYKEAEEQAVLMTQQFPSFMIGWKALGAVLAQKGRVSDALFANEKAVALSPQDAENHNREKVDYESVQSVMKDLDKTSLSNAMKRSI